MLQFINTKLLILIAALLGSLVGYEAFSHHRQQQIDRQAKEFRRPARVDERAAQPSGWANALRKH
jgi:hypothetical protein